MLLFRILRRVQIFSGQSCSLVQRNSLRQRCGVKNKTQVYFGLGESGQTGEIQVVSQSSSSPTLSWTHTWATPPAGHMMSSTYRGERGGNSKLLRFVHMVALCDIPAGGLKASGSRRSLRLSSSILRWSSSAELGCSPVPVPDGDHPPVGRRRPRHLPPEPGQRSHRWKKKLHIGS